MKIASVLAPPSVLNASAMFALVGLLSAYIVGFYFNPVSNMVPPWKQNPFFSISSAMHFGEKAITLPLFALAVLGFTFCLRLPCSDSRLFSTKDYHQI
jgi:hypothetical protein